MEAQVMQGRRAGPHPPRVTTVDRMVVALALCLFLTLACYQLQLPGLHYDEAKEAGNNAVQVLRGLPVRSFRGAELQVGSLHLPLMVQDYIGALNVYLALVPLALLGISPLALRLVPVLLASVTLTLLYLLGREISGRVAGVVTLLLVAVNPSFVFWSRQGIFVTNITATLAVASSLTAVRWYRHRRPRDLYLTAALWGLGIYAKLLFVWIIGATVGVWFLGRSVLALGSWQRNDRADGPTSGRRAPLLSHSGAAQLALAAVCFLVPLLPLALFNLRTGGTFSSVLSNLDSSYYGVRNAALSSNLVARLKQVVVLFRGDHLWYLGARPANPVATWIAIGLLVAVLLLGLARAVRNPSSQRRLGAWPLSLFFCLLVVVQSSFTVSDLFVTHYAILLPFVFLAVGTLVGQIVDRGGRLWLVPALLAVVCWAGVDLWVTIQYHQALTATGGHASHSDAIYEVAEYLDTNRVESPFVLDWGIEAPLVFLTAGRVQPVEIFGYDRLDAPSEDVAERLRDTLDDPAVAYLFHVPEETVFGGRRELFDIVVAEAGLVPRIEAAFHERSGRMLYVLTRIERP